MQTDRQLDKQTIVGRAFNSVQPQKAWCMSPIMTKFYFYRWTGQWLCVFESYYNMFVLVKGLARRGDWTHSIGGSQVFICSIWILRYLWCSSYPCLMGPRSCFDLFCDPYLCLPFMFVLILHSVFVLFLIIIVLQWQVLLPILNMWHLRDRRSKLQRHLSLKKATRRNMLIWQWSCYW